MTRGQRLLPKGINTENVIAAADLTNSLEALCKTCPRLAVENHGTGELYRINTLEGVFIRAVKRVPARIGGDGTSTIAALIDAFNTHPIRNDPRAYAKRLPLDAELTSHLQKQSLTFKTVPETGRDIQLTPIWKSSRGGHSEDVTKHLQPDNVALCETVARSFGLPVTRIDPIPPDASVPWHDNGAIICEVDPERLTRRRWKTAFVARLPRAAFGM